MMPSRPSAHRFPASRSGAFTLVEILVVIGIILLLSAISFPVFKSVQERGAQTTCASNMQQIYLAVRLYKDDEREYPASLAALLPDSDYLAAPPAKPSVANLGGTGYFRKTREELVCPNDDFQVVEQPAVAPSTTPILQARSSYGDVSTDPLAAGTATSEVGTNNTLYSSGSTHNTTYYGAGDVRDWGRLAWNYWGYDDWGQAFRSEAEAILYFRALPTTPPEASSANLLRDPKKAPTTYVSGTRNPGYVAYAPYAASPSPYFNPRGFSRDVDESGNPIGAPYEEPREANMFKYSLANPQAPLSTIITHCVYHRLQTAANATTPGADQLYDATNSANGANGVGARDIILRLDGTARSYDVSKWNSPNFPRQNHGSNWQNSDF